MSLVVHRQLLLVPASPPPPIHFNLQPYRKTPQSSLQIILLSPLHHFLFLCHWTLTHSCTYFDPKLELTIPRLASLSIQISSTNFSPLEIIPHPATAVYTPYLLTLGPSRRKYGPSLLRRRTHCTRTRGHCRGRKLCLSLPGDFRE